MDGAGVVLVDDGEARREEFGDGAEFVGGESGFEAVEGGAVGVGCGGGPCVGGEAGVGAEGVEVAVEPIAAVGAEVSVGVDGWEAGVAELGDAEPEAVGVVGFVGVGGEEQFGPACVEESLGFYGGVDAEGISSWEAAEGVGEVVAVGGRQEVLLVESERFLSGGGGEGCGDERADEEAVGACVGGGVEGAGEVAGGEFVVAELGVITRGEDEELCAGAERGEVGEVGVDAEGVVDAEVAVGEVGGAAGEVEGVDVVFEEGAEGIGREVGVVESVGDAAGLLVVVVGPGAPPSEGGVVLGSDAGGREG